MWKGESSVTLPPLQLYKKEETLKEQSTKNIYRKDGSCLFAIKKVILPVTITIIRMWHTRLQIKQRSFSRVQHLDSGLMFGQGQVLEQLFNLPLSVLEVIKGKTQ